MASDVVGSGSSPVSPATLLDQLAARDAIANNLARHSRGVDRNIFGLLAGAYHPGATVSYGLFEGSAADMAVFLTSSMAGQPITLHRTSNMLIKVEGETASSESYVIAYLRAAAAPAAGVQRMIGGRYLDRHARRNGAWRIVHRTYVMDWNTNAAAAEALQETDGELARLSPFGGHGASDPGLALLALGRAAFSKGTAKVTTDLNELDRLVSRAALSDLGLAYCRGVDRADEALVASVFHPDARIVAGVFNGDPQGFARFITDLVRNGLRRSAHTVANAWIEIDGDQAVGETYVIAFAGTDETDALTGGRYIDRYARREGAWKIAERTFVADWNITRPTSADEGEIYAQLSLRGAHTPDDPVYAFWA